MGDRARRFFVPSIPQKGNSFALGEEGSDHAKVLRLKLGAEIEVFDGQGRQARASVSGITDGIFWCTVHEVVHAFDEQPRLVLLAALPKQDTLERVTRSATELGVHEIRWLYTEHTVPKWPSDKVATKLERLDRIARDAARQSERQSVPQFMAPEPLEVACANKPRAAWGIAFHARAELALPPFPAQASAAWVVLGPEGGFSEAEVQTLSTLAYRCVSMGSTILRVETAVSAALALVLDRMHL